MERGEARKVLGVGADATPEQVRAAYRRLVRRHHPDVAAGASEATARTARITEAYAVLQRADPALPAARPATPPEVLDGDTLTLVGSPDDAFLLVLEALHRIGDVTHIDRDGGLLEALVHFDDGQICSLVVSFQGRATGVTEAFCTLQSLDARPTPPVAPVVAQLIEVLTRR